MADPNRQRRRPIVLAGLVVLLMLAAFAAGAVVPELRRADRVPLELDDPAFGGGGADGSAQADDADDAEGADDAGDGASDGAEDGTPGDDGDDGDDGAGGGAAADPRAQPSFDPPAWIVIVQSLTEAGTTGDDAEASASAFRARGVTPVDVLHTDEVGGLTPGLWVVHAGGSWALDAEDAAAAHCEDLSDAGVDCYLRRVTPKG